MELMYSPDSSLTLMQATQQSLNGAADSAKNAAKAKNDEQLTESAKEFEAMFMTEMLKPMFEELKPDPMFGGGKGEEIFNGFMLEEYGKMMAETGQIGIADQVKAEMLRMQEGK